MYGSLTTKELKKKHSPRLVGGAERTNGKVLEESGQVRHLADQGRWWLVDWVVPHLHVDKLGGTTGE